MPACGGQSFDEPSIRATLEAAKIAPQCVDEKTFEFIINAVNNFSLVIAKGYLAINGENSKFDLLIK